ncbi:hypothetical protein B4Q04_00760 [Zobellia sp. OII3]|uniref:hypothetical protein n=1 Tax=Zobellia sp. OII3 TaxID=2034520 RepID=UPI000B52A189|nr:hypothetical protein [Zobellia sp. OII3]OWW26248.1 hypothetical protein B4Q04_00760 [Zobellia sp. OII3]
MKIGENPDQIDDTSLLELESTTRALVLSRINNEQMFAINPKEGALVYNTEESCVFYFNGATWADLCNGSGDLSFTDNNDGTFTIHTDSGSFTFNTAPETLTRFIDNGDGSYTYVDENKQETIINTGISGVAHRGTPGSIFFANEDNGSPFEANEHLFWDNTNKRLGIGTNTPSNQVEVVGILKSSRITSSFGTASFPSYHFTGSFNSGLFVPSSGDLAMASAGKEVARITGGNRMGIMVTNPQATLHVGGDLRVDGAIIGRNGTTVAKQQKTETNIRRLSSRKAHLSLTDYTVVLEDAVEYLSLPIPGEQNLGHIYIIKDLGGQTTKLNIPYVDLKSKKSLNTKHKGTLWLQSDGTDWQQIN